MGCPLLSGLLGYKNVWQGAGKEGCFSRENFLVGMEHLRNLYNLFRRDQQVSGVEAMATRADLHSEATI